MSHPSINRWGLNLFWYNFWFADKNYSFLLQQDRILNTFFFIYINFGLLHPVHPFLNRYWYGDDSKFNYNFPPIHNAQYFRFVDTPYDETDVTGHYRARKQLSHVYLTKIWIIRYDKWFILNFYCFRPRETELVKKRVVKKKKLRLDPTSFTSYNSIKIFKRLKFILGYYYYARISRPSTYIF